MAPSVDEWPNPLSTRSLISRLKMEGEIGAVIKPGLMEKIDKKPHPFGAVMAVQK